MFAQHTIRRLLVLACFWQVSPMAATAAEPLHGVIDREVNARSGGPMAERSTDAEFLRRVTLDLTGIIPRADEVEAFLQDQAPDKRARRIDLLLMSPEHVRRMQEAVSAAWLERRTGSTVTDRQWNEFLRESFLANKPWDQLTREILFPDDEPTLAAAGKFLSVSGREKNLHQLTQDVARLFLGRNIQCAQCHDHPNVDDYTQAEYFGLYSFLQETPQAARSEFESVFVPGKQATFPRLPGRDELVIPTFTKTQIAEAKPYRPRLLLSTELTAPENRAFARNAVNRLWFLMFGRGLVHPLDQLHAKNPASHPELLEALADEFQSHRFDMRHLLREMALSETYQRSGRLPAGVRPEEVLPQSYRISNPRPLSPEQLAWSLLRATGQQASFESAVVPEKLEFGWFNYINGRATSPPGNIPELLDLFTGIFGNPPGEAEVEFTPSMGQALFLLNEKLLQQWLAPGTSLMQQLAAESDPARIAHRLSITIYSRPPHDTETDLVAELLARADAPREQLLADIAWAMLASDEFRVNH